MSAVDEARVAGRFAHPGSDTRQWCSYGVVMQDAPGARSVRYVDEDGETPHPFGVVVDVTLHPSGAEVQCRVASQCAGNGEGEWYPFIAGDEVVVLIPEGNEQAACVIVGRLNQKLDVFPTLVAGQDATQNNFGFRRQLAPQLYEIGAGWQVRSAVTGAGITIDDSGQVFFASGDKHLLALTSDVISLATGDGNLFFQMRVNDEQVTFGTSQTAMVVGDAASSFLTPGTLALGTGGNNPVFHAAHIEGVAGLASLIVDGIKSALNGVGFTGTSATGGAVTILAATGGHLLAQAIDTSAIVNAAIGGAGGASASYAGTIGGSLGTPGLAAGGLLIG